MILSILITYHSLPKRFLFTSASLQLSRSRCLSSPNCYIVHRSSCFCRCGSVSKLESKIRIVCNRSIELAPEHQFLGIEI